jgi:uncharacterized protein (DUF2062 family)
MKERIKRYIRKNIKEPILGFLQQGITPEKLALSIVFGTLLGIIPLLGTTTVLCAIAAFALRLNMISIQFVNYLVYPLQLLLFVPFLKTGEYIFNVPPIPLSFEKVIDMFISDWLGSIKTIWLVNLTGISVWFVLSIPAGFLIYYLTLPVLKKFALYFTK